MNRSDPAGIAGVCFALAAVIVLVVQLTDLLTRP